MLSQLTQLKETGIWIIELPKSSIRHYINEANDRINYTFINSKGKRCLDGDYIEKADWQILGTITPDNISFDPEPYLERVTCRYDVPQRVAGFMDVECFRNYSTEQQYGKAFGCFKENSANESLYTLLNSCGIEVDNKLHLALIKK